MPSSCSSTSCGRTSRAPISPTRFASFSVASGATARRGPDLRNRELAVRVASAAVLAPLGIGAILAGSPWIDLLVLAVAAAMAWEWARLCRSGRFDALGWALAGAAVLSVVLAVAGLFVLAALAAVAASAALAAAPAAASDRFWIGVAPAAVALPCIAVLWLRADAEWGLHAVLWLVGIVWATDIGGYFTGRTLGGPLLAPRISPKKTWSGLCGGVVCAAAWSLAFAGWIGTLPVWRATLFGAGLAVLAQAGDLAESALKRRHGAKDASRLIPGHGGVLDRLDGMLPTAPAVAALMMVMKGGDGGWP